MDWDRLCRCFPGKCASQETSDWGRLPGQDKLEWLPVPASSGLHWMQEIRSRNQDLLVDGLSSHFSSAAIVISWLIEQLGAVRRSSFRACASPSPRSSTCSQGG